MLEDHADAAPQRHQPVLVQLPDIGAVDQHAAGAGALQHVDGAQQVDLPAPLRPMMPKISPRAMEKDTPDSAATGPCGPW